jgi:hypothetical protein
VDRRIQVFEDIAPESEDEEEEKDDLFSPAMSQTSTGLAARSYVGELIQKVVISDGKPAFVLH